MVLLYGLEGEKKAGGGFVELAFFFVALAVAVVGRVCFLSDAGKRFGIDIEVSQALAFSVLIMLGGIAAGIIIEKFLLE